MGYLEYSSLLVLLLLFSRDGACAPISANPTETVAETETQTTSSSTNTSILTTTQSFTSTASDSNLSQDMGLLPPIIPSITSIISGVIGGGSDNASPRPSQSQIDSGTTSVPAPTDTAENDSGNTSPSQSSNGNQAEDTTPSASSDSSSPSNSSNPSHNSDTPNISEGPAEPSAGASNGNNGATTITLSNGSVVQVFRTETDATSLLSIQTSIVSETGAQNSSSSHSAGSTAGAIIGTLAGISLLILIVLIWRRRVRSSGSRRSGSGPLAYFTSQKHHKSSQRSVDENGNANEKTGTGYAQNWTDFPRSPNSSKSNSNLNSNSIDSHYSPPPTGSSQSHQSAGSRLVISTQPPSPFVTTDDGMYSPDPFKSKF